MVRMQTACLASSRLAALFCLIYVAKLILVVLSGFGSDFVRSGSGGGFPGRAAGAEGSGVVHCGVRCWSRLALVATYVSYSRAIDFAHELPQVQIAHPGNRRQSSQAGGRARKDNRSGGSAPPSEKTVPVTLTEGNSWTDTADTTMPVAVSELVLTITFVPFLVYFMLSWKDHVRTASVMLFSMENRNTAYVMLGLISGMIRSFIVGNFIIGVFLSACSMAAFGLMGLPYFYFIGVISGFLSLIPYLGVDTGDHPAAVRRSGACDACRPLIMIFVIVVGLHLFAMNVLYPKILGKRLQLNPLALTISLLFWGWMWGASGLILAVPITGAAKIIFDHVERLRPFGTWLGRVAPCMTFPGLISGSGGMPVRIECWHLFFIGRRRILHGAHGEMH